MTYTRPNANEAHATWSNMEAYTRPSFNEANATWHGAGTPQDPLGLGYKWTIEWREQDAETIIASVGGLVQKEYIMTDLQAGTWYEWRIKGESIEQNTEWSEWQSFKTLPH